MMSKEGQAERKSEPTCLNALWNHCVGPRLTTSKLLVLRQIYSLFVHDTTKHISKQNTWSKTPDIYLLLPFSAVCKIFVLMRP